MPLGFKGNADGSGAIQVGGSDAITISTGLNTTFAGTVTATGTVAGTTGTLYPLVSGTSQASTSGTSIDFTSIPSWVKRITVMLNGVSTNGSSNLQIQLGSGSVTTTGYNSGAYTPTTNASSTTGLLLTGVNISTTAFYGNIIICGFGSNIWTSSHSLGGPAGSYNSFGGGQIALSGTLDRVRITTVNGTDTFDAGSINILYE